MTDWSKWERDVSSNYPLVYKEFDGKVQKDGKRRKYWIQDLTEEYIPVAVRAYVELFLDDEPISHYLGCVRDPICQKEMGIIWKSMLEKKLSVVCLSKDDQGKIQVAGFNCLYIMTKDEKKVAYESPRTQKLIDILDYFYHHKDAFAEFGDDMFIGAMGLFVMPDFRGEGLGQELLDSRKQICQALGFKSTLTIFTSFISQKQAARAGFKDYVVESYENLAKLDKNKFEVVGIQEHTKICKLMVNLY